MAIDEFVPVEAEKPLYDFTSAKPGTSQWVETNEERIALYQAFKRWVAKSPSRIAGKTVRVGDDDPRGAGYRLVFTAVTQTLKPAVIARLPSIAKAAQGQEYILAATGLHDDDEIMKAVMSCEIIPTTVTEANMIAKRIWAGTTPHQIEYCVGKYGCTWREHQEQSRARYAERHEESQRRLEMYKATPEMRRGDEDDE